MNEAMMKIKQDLCDILQDFAQKGLHQPQDVEVVKNAISGIQKIKILEEMENFRSGGFSSRSYDDGGSYRRGGRSYEDGSYRRGGRSYDEGGYSRERDGGYSGHDLRENLQRMLEQATPEDKEMIKRWMQQV